MGVSSDSLSDPLVSAGLLLALAVLILLVGLALQVPGRRRRRDAPPPEPPVGNSELDRAHPTAVGSPPEPALPPSQAWMALVPPWIDELESKLSTAFETRIVEMKQVLEARIEGVEEEFSSRIEKVEDELDTGLDEMEAKVSAATESTDDQHWREAFEARIDEGQRKIEGVEAGAGAASQNGAGGDRASMPPLLDRAPSNEERSSRA